MRNLGHVNAVKQCIKRSTYIRFVKGSTGWLILNCIISTKISTKLLLMFVIFPTYTDTKYEGRCRLKWNSYADQLDAIYFKRERETKKGSASKVR